MTLKDALSFVIDYGKFIATLWNGYLVFTVAVIGWLVAIRNSKDSPPDASLRKVIVGAYLAAALIFGIVLAYNNLYLLELHEMLHALAKHPSEAEAGAAAAYMKTLGKHELGPVVIITLALFAIVSIIAAGVMWFIAGYKKPPTTA